MGRKTFVLDTNVLLHDPESIQKFSKSDIVIPMVVLEELDILKKRNDDLGKNARVVVKYIDSLKAKNNGNFTSGIEIEEGLVLKLHLDREIKNSKTFPLALDRNSNKILLIANNLKKEGQNVTFVSKDFVSRVKAEAMGIYTEDYEICKPVTKTVYKGIQSLDATKEEIDFFYKEGCLSKEEIKFYPNEYCILKSDQSASAIGKYNSFSKKLEPLLEYKRGVWGIYPLNVEQRCVIDLLLRDEIKLVTLIGPAGTGKTLLALACGMKKVFDEGVYSKILVSRPIIPLGKDIGFLPGTKEEKLFHWMQPIYDNLEVLLQQTNGEGNEKSAFEWIMESKKIEMEAVTYIRGRTLPKLYMIIDEAQNLTPHEIKTIISRAGKNTKVVLTGDPSQIDNPNLDKESNGLNYTVNKFKNQRIFGHVYLEKTERSELAKIAAEIM